MTKQQKNEGENSQKMNKHPLHELIGEHLNSVDFGNAKKIIDPACRGKQNISLFLTQDKSNDNEICNVDFMMLKNNKIKIIIEIEETNNKPTQILGKFLASALAKFYINKKDNDDRFQMADSVCFIQIMDTKPLPEKSKKRKQWTNIEKAINEILPTLKTNIKTYRLFYGSTEGIDKIDLNELTLFIINELDR